MEGTTSLSFKYSVATKLGELEKSRISQGGEHYRFIIDAATGLTLGLVHQECWMRPDEADDTTEPESGKWTAALASVSCFDDQMQNVNSVCDHEADIFAYL